MIKKDLINEYEWWEFYSSEYDRFLIGQINERVYEGLPPDRKFRGEVIMKKIVCNDGSQFRDIQSSGNIRFDSKKIEELKIYYTNLIRKVSQ